MVITPKGNPTVFLALYTVELEATHEPTAHGLHTPAVALKGDCLGDCFQTELLKRGLRIFGNVNY